MGGSTPLGTCLQASLFSKLGTCFLVASSIKSFKRNIHKIGHMFFSDF